MSNSQEIAKEITIAIIQKASESNFSSLESFGDEAAKLYITIHKAVLDANNDVPKPPVY